MQPWDDMVAGVAGVVVVVVPGVDAIFGQHTRALERASHKWTEGQQGRPDQLDRLTRPVGPVPRVSPKSVISRDNYHTYVVKNGKIYKQTSKEITNALTWRRMTSLQAN